MRITIQLLIIYLLAAFAGHTSATEITVRGFASIVAGQSLEDEEEIYGYEGELDFRNDSLAALQFNANLGDGLSATVQLMGRGRDEFATRVEWAYVTYEFNDSVQLSAGRIGTPFYYYSDFLDVRYTQPWLVAPETVYGFTFPGYDGLSLVTKNSWGSWDSTFQFIFGQIEGETADFAVDVDNLSGMNWTLNRDWLTLRATFITASAMFSIDDFENLASLAQQLGAGFNADVEDLVGNIRADNDRAVFFGLASSVDYNDWLLNLEFINYSLDDSVLGETAAHYVMLGKRINSYTPYITYSNSRGEADGEVLTNIPPQLVNFSIQQAGGATLPMILQGVVSAFNTDTSLWVAGVRYDFHPSAAFKVEYLQQTDIADEQIDLLRFGVDLVF